MTTISAPRIGGVVQEEWASISKDYAALREADPRIEAVETWSVPCCAWTMPALRTSLLSRSMSKALNWRCCAVHAMTLRRWRPCLSIEIEERHRVGKHPRCARAAARSRLRRLVRILRRMAAHRATGSRDDAAWLSVTGGVHGVAPIRVQLLFRAESSADRSWPAWRDFRNRAVSRSPCDDKAGRDRQRQPNQKTGKHRAVLTANPPRNGLACRADIAIAVTKCRKPGIFPRLKRVCAHPVLTARNRHEPLARYRHWRTHVGRDDEVQVGRDGRRELRRGGGVSF